MISVEIPILDFIEITGDEAVVEIEGVITPEEKPTKDCPGGSLEVELVRFSMECTPDVTIRLQNLILQKYEEIKAAKEIDTYEERRKKRS